MSGPAAAPQARPGRIPWPPLVYLVAIITAAGLTALYPLPWFEDVLNDVLFATGWLVLLGAAALWISALRAMRRAKTTWSPTGTPQHLLADGPFGISRNPIYLAMTMVLIAIGLIGGMAWFLPLAFIAAFATAKLAIEREEKVLFAKFGKKYRDYSLRVRRWI
jgi:protein-S-isoprenylcysteine O-methyltransferase Ste14